MKIIKTYESFNLNDLDLGRFSDIIEKDKLIPNEDGTYDYEGHLNFNSCSLTSLLNIPIRFRRVKLNFACGANNLISLEGAPLYVGGSFSCSSNNLISLQYAPLEVGGYFDCRYNSLFTLKHLSKVDPDKFEGALNFSDDGSSYSRGRVSYIVGRMTYEQQMAELDFFDKYDLEASKKFQEILDSLGVEYGTYRKEMKDLVKGNSNYGMLGL